MTFLISAPNRNPAPAEKRKYVFRDIPAENKFFWLGLYTCSGGVILIAFTREAWERKKH
jgi:hypothetical protein